MRTVCIDELCRLEDLVLEHCLKGVNPAYRNSVYHFGRHVYQWRNAVPEFCR